MILIALGNRFQTSVSKALNFNQVNVLKHLSNREVKPSSGFPFKKLRLDQFDQGIMAKPESKSTSVQVLPIREDKCTQTVWDRNTRRRSSSSSRRMPPMSPGRGYWHQQLDYICNHLKSHAYNNVEFRKEISEPCLCDFKSANIIKEENNVLISLSFTPYVPDKSTIPTSENRKSEDKYPKGT